MKKGQKYALCLLFLTSCVQADEFYLKEKTTGRVYGPFRTEEGAKVDVGWTTFTVADVKKGGGKEKSDLEKKISQIIVDEIDFRKAPLEEAVRSLVQFTRELDPGGIGVNMVMVKAPAIEKEANPAPVDPFGFGEAPARKPEPEITLQLRRVSVLQILDVMMEQTGYSYRVKDNILTIYPE